MDTVYQENIEASINNAIPNIVYYLILGLLTGYILEFIMPKVDPEKDNIGLFLEIFVQITLIVFAFMMISSKGGTRNGIIVFILAIIGSQPSLCNKIHLLGTDLIGKPVTENKENYQDKNIKDEKNNKSDKQVKKLSDKVPGSTSIDQLPK